MAIKPPAPSRRTFLQLVGKAGGAGALYETMVAFGMLQAPAAWAGPAQLPAAVGAGKRVVILGAGMAGLAAAYELQKAGYACTILETLGRIGGRNFTARRGTQVVEDTGPSGRTTQVCAFDEGLYMNLGPARLPFHHPRVMHYCRELGVPLEVYVMSTTANLYQTDQAFDGQAQTRYRLGNDVNSHIGELLSKAINSKALDAELTEDDRASFLKLLASFGDVPDAPTIVGAETPRNGCLTPMTVEAVCKANPRLPLTDLLKSKLWQNRFNQPSDGEWQPTLFQPVGGMDKIVDAFVKRLRTPVRTNCEVISIDNQADGVIVAYRNRKSGKTATIEADYCLSNMPLQKLAQVKSNLSSDFKQAVDHARAGALYKLAWQANRRFWEEAPYNIFGGISYTDSPITQMWYPSNDYMSSKGIIAGSYSYFEQAEAFGRMTLSDRVIAGRRDAIKLHKEFSSESLVPSSKAVSIAWNQAEGQSGGVAIWDMNGTEDNLAYRRLLRPDGRFFVIGDQVSPLPGWQEGAFLSSEHAVLQITGRRPTTASALERAPDTRRLLQGIA
jgi:monoamine oxidase